MTVPGHRHERLAEEIRHEVSAMLAGELKDPRLSGLVTVSEVRVTPDRREARIFVRVEGDSHERARTLQGLEAASGYIRHELAERFHLRRRLDVIFALDRSEEYAQHIEALLRKVKGPSGS